MQKQTPHTALEAVADRGFLLSDWPWRSAVYLLSTTPVAGLAAIPLLIAVLPWRIALGRQHLSESSLPVTVGLLFLGAALIAVIAPLVAAPVAEVERLRLRLVDRRPLTVSGAGGGLLALYRSERTWRAVAYTVLLVVGGPVLVAGAAMAVLQVVALLAGPLVVRLAGGPVSLGVPRADSVDQALPYAVAGLLLLPALPYAFAVLAGGHAALARVLLRGNATDGLRAELVEVSRSRARLVDAFETERRRIERDLHDGAQQRLVGLTLQLGLARLDVPADSPAAASVGAAHEQAKQLMDDLRELIHGIYPQVLTDLGLPAALHGLAERAAIPVTVNAALPERLPGHVEATAYFMAAEALTNVARHSGARHAAVTVRRRSGDLVVEVSDDGHGGADPARGTGLTGLADRVAVSGGRMLLSSPAGGPTLVRLEVPCR